MVLIGSEIGKLPHKLLYCLKLSDFFSPWYNSHFQVPGRYNVFGQWFGFNEWGCWEPSDQGQRHFTTRIKVNSVTTMRFSGILLFHFHFTNVCERGIRFGVQDGFRANLILVVLCFLHRNLLVCASLKPINTRGFWVKKGRGESGRVVWEEGLVIIMLWWKGKKT